MAWFLLHSKQISISSLTHLPLIDDDSHEEETQVLPASPPDGTFFVLLGVAIGIPCSKPQQNLKEGIRRKQFLGPSIVKRGEVKDGRG